MASPASIAKHPIHPMLVSLPIGLWIFSFVCDLIARFGSGSPIWSDVAFYCIGGGIVGALLAAVPGLIDYLSITDHRAKRIGTFHLILNLTAVFLYAFNFWMRMSDRSSGVVLSFITIIALGISGWLGGELVYVHGMGVEEQTPAREPLRKAG